MPDDYLFLSEEVRTALSERQPVVALESTIITHGMPYPQNVETALKVEQSVRDQGALPATIALMDGKIRVGLDQDAIEILGKAGESAIKTSRRDFPFVLQRKAIGATTVAGSMIAASMAGIRIFATGGIGGVHRGGEHSMDISADLQELARTEVAVVCAGAKSILDLKRTLEYLETMGVPVIGFQTREFPAFFTRKSGLEVDYRVETVEELAEGLHLKWTLPLSGGVVVANPIPSAYEPEYAPIQEAIGEALRELAEQKISGKAITPFLLHRVEQLTGGSSLKANIQLVLHNAALAARLAIAYTAFRNFS